MSKPRGIAPGQYCHIYNRGTDKRPIFYDDADRFRFLCHLVACNGSEPVRLAEVKPLTLERLADERGKTLVSIGAYCLMDNHFHLVLKTRSPKETARFLQKLAGYTEYFNRRHGRSGSLFQGTAKSRAVEDAADLANLLAYVNLNPLDRADGPALGHRISSEEAVCLKTHRYSSLVDYLGEVRPEAVLLDRNALPPGFGQLPLPKL